MEVLYNIIVIFLLLNAIFWSLFTHKQHCEIARMFGIQQCPSHWIHITFGIVCFILAILIKQRNYIFMYYEN